MKTHVHLPFFFVLGLLATTAVLPISAQDPTVTIQAIDPQASEAFSDPGTFTARRTGSTNFSVLVFYRLSGTASNGVDYEQLGGTAEIPAGATAASFRVKPIDDSEVEGTETVVARIVPSPMMCITCGYLIGTPDTAEVFIYDNDGVATNHPPVVRLNSPQNGDVFPPGADIPLRAYAQDAEDRFIVKVEFFEGANSLGFGTFVPTTCPAPYCPYFALTWSNVPPGEYILTARATDSAGATSVSDPVHISVFSGVNIYATDPLATEHSPLTAMAPDTATFTVQRTDTSQGIVVYYEISGTASNGIDYRKLSGEVTIPAGATSANIVVDPIFDNLSEGSETVVLTLIPPCPQCLFANPPCEVPQGTNCYPIGPDNRAVAYIRDSETTGTNNPPSVQLVSPHDGDVFAAPADIKLIAFAQDPEDHYYPLTVEFFEGSHSLGFGTFVPGRCAVCPNYVLGWSNVPPGRYVLTAKVTDSAGASAASSPVRITVGEGNLPTVVNIVARDAFASEGTNFWRSATTPTWDAWHVNVGGTNTATFVVHREGPTNADVTINYEIGGTASNGIDYATLSGSVTIAAGKHSAQIVVVPIEDKIAEGIETVVLKLRPSSDYTIGIPSHAAAIILDNDLPRPPCVVLPDGEFHLCRLATNGFCYRLEASSDLVHWTSLCTNVVTDGALHFVDPDTPPLSARFYRVQPESGLSPDN